MVNNCIPLILTNQYGNKYPGIWDKMDDIMQKQKERPINERRSNDLGSDIIKMFNEKYEHVADIVPYGINSEIVKYVVDPGIVQLARFLHIWRLHKQIYKFPKEMEHILYKQNDGMDTPIKIFENLPYDCIYIETNDLFYKEKTILGFFVKRTDATTNLNGAWGYEICLIYEDLKTKVISIRYDDIKESTGIFDALMNTMVKEMRIRDNETGKIYSYEDKEVMDFAKKSMLDVYNNSEYSILPKIVQLVLYICAENKEIEENALQKNITRKPKNKKYIKDKYREVQIWDCGNKISEKIRSFLIPNDRSYSSSIGIGDGKTKAPHSRKGHWHHFWIGKRNSEERKLILKWVAPTLVNGNPNTVNINVVENENLEIK